jgi:hypothetical protein
VSNRSYNEPKWNLTCNYQTILLIPSDCGHLQVPVLLLPWGETMCLYGTAAANGPIVHLPDNTEWSKSHANHIKIFIDGCNSIKFDWINKHTISLWLYNSPRRSCHVATCLRQSVRCLSTVEVQGCIFHTQRVFIVEHYLASRSFLTCHNEFRDTFPDSPVPNK